MVTWKIFSLEKYFCFWTELSLCEASIFFLVLLELKFLPHGYLSNRTLTPKSQPQIPSHLSPALGASFCPETWQQAQVISGEPDGKPSAFLGKALRGLHV